MAPCMTLHAALPEKLSAACAAAQPSRMTRRDAVLPDLAGKVHA